MKRMNPVLLACAILLFGQSITAQTARKRQPQRPARSEPMNNPITRLPAGWRLATRGKGIAVYYDPSRVLRPANNVVRAWVKYESEQTSDPVYASSLELNEYNCANGTTRTISLTKYYRANNEPFSPSIRNPTWEYVLPDSIGESMLNILCGRRKDLEELDEEEESIDYEISLLTTEGFNLTWSDKHQQAENAFKKALNLRPNAEAYRGLGGLYLKMKRYDDSIKAYKNAIRIKPDDAYSYDGLGDAYKEMQRHQEAVEAYKAAIRIDPESISFLSNLERLYENLSLKEEANNVRRQEVEVYKNKIKTKPSVYDFNGLARNYIELELLNSAAQTYVEGIKRFPTSARLYTGLAELQFKQNQPDAALTNLNTAKRLEPDYAETYYVLAQIYISQKNKNLALEQYEKLKTLKSFYADFIKPSLNKMP